MDEEKIRGAALVFAPGISGISTDILHALWLSEGERFALQSVSHPESYTCLFHSLLVTGMFTSDAERIPYLKGHCKSDGWNPLQQTWQEQTSRPFLSLKVKLVIVVGNV